MKISGNGPDKLRALVDSLRTNETPSVGGPSRTGRTSAGSPAQSGDRVDISGLAQEFVQLRESILKTPEIREQTVASLKDALASGRYKIDDERLARFMSEEFLGNR
ncbi:MAG: flagellar biosynthesis anti-sigma factor FlgM [Acidobacteriota bacterium]